MKVLILQDISSVKFKNSCINYAEKGQTLNAIQRNEETLLVDGVKEKFILFIKDENKTYKLL